MPSVGLFIDYISDLVDINPTYISIDPDMTVIDLAIAFGLSSRRAHARNRITDVGHDDESPQSIRTRSHECHDGVTLDAPHYSPAAAV